MDIDSYVEAIVNAKVSFGSNRMRDGKYIFTVKRALAKKSDQNASAYYIAELFVDAASPVTVPADLTTTEERATPELLTPNKDGSDVGVVMELGSTSGPGNIKAFLCGLDSVDPDSIANDEAGKLKLRGMIKASVSPWNPLRGIQVKCTTYRKLIKTGKNAGKPFIGMRWEGIPQTKEVVLARRAKLDADDKAALDKASAPKT